MKEILRKAIDTELCLYIESCHYQAEACKNACAQAVAVGVDPAGEAYAKLETRLADALKNYEDAKKAMIAQYQPQGDWSLDFASCDLTAEGFGA